LAAFGQAGVERVLDIMNAELALTMRQCGATSVAKIAPSSAVFLNTSHLGRFPAPELAPIPR